MLVRDFIHYLENGELATAYDKFSDPDDLDMLMSNIRIALTTLYTRFPLIEKQVTIQRFPHISNYVLDRRYAVSNRESTELYRYILDTLEDPFTNDVISIRSGYTGDGREVMLNDYSRPTNTFFVSGNTIQIPDTLYCGELAIFIYQANHPVITDENSPLLVPEYLLEALLAYVSSRMFGTRSDEAAMKQAANYLGKYDAECEKVKEFNLIPNCNTVTNIKPIRGGWI